MSTYTDTAAEYGGKRYASQGEAEYARRLDLLQAAGQVDGWRRGREWVLLDAPRRRDRIVYVPDFEVEVGGARRVVDFKGVVTPVFSLKATIRARPVLGGLHQVYERAAWGRPASCRPPAR